MAGCGWWVVADSVLSVLSRADPLVFSLVGMARGSV